MLLELGKGNNGETFEALIRRILGWIDQPHKTVVVMDNAQYHRKKDRIEEFTNRGVSILFLPPSSSDLNPIGKYCFLFSALQPPLFSVGRISVEILPAESISVGIKAVI